MKRSTKIITAAIGTIPICVVVGLINQYTGIRDQGRELTRHTMRAAGLVDENKTGGDSRGSALYRTTPVSAAWRALQAAALT